MRIEDEVQTKSFQSEFHKAQVNIIFSAWWLKSSMTPYLKKHGLSHEQFNVLRIIRGQKNKPVCVKDITARMLERNSNTTRIIDKLEAKAAEQYNNFLSRYSEYKEEYGLDYETLNWVPLKERG